MWAFRLLMGLAVLACIGASAIFAFEFGWTRGATEVHHWTYAFAGAALDLFKAGLPIFGAAAWHDSKPGRSLVCWLLFAVLTVLSLWCAYGTTATQLAEKFANQVVASAALMSRQTTLDRLRAQRDELGLADTPEEAVETARTAVAVAMEQASAERARGGCKGICRQREAAEVIARETLRKVQADRATTIKAVELDAKITAAEEALRQVDVKAAAMEADPQSASMAKASGKDQILIAAISLAVFAVAIELGSGVGFWLVFGHGAASTRREDTEPSVASTALVPISRTEAVDLQIIDEKPQGDHRAFLPRGRPAKTQPTRPIARCVVGIHAVVFRPRARPRISCHVRAAGALAEGPDRGNGVVFPLRARRGILQSRTCARTKGPAASRHDGQGHVDRPLSRGTPARPKRAGDNC